MELEEAISEFELHLDSFSGEFQPIKHRMYTNEWAHVFAKEGSRWDNGKNAKAEELMSKLPQHLQQRFEEAIKPIVETYNLRVKSVMQKATPIYLSPEEGE